jgi:hypothetical protein
MILQSKYEIGQRVFAARVSYTSTLVPCPDCLGSKEWTVTTPSGESWKCSEELKRVAGLREAEMARIRERKKKGTIYRKGKGV